MDNISLNKKVYSKNQYVKVIDTQFTQLVNSNNPLPDIPIISVQQFFDYYNQLFFDIPKEGDINSHEYLIKKSSEYINFNPINSDIEALIEEINSLQAQNLELNQQIVELSSK